MLKDIELEIERIISKSQVPENLIFSTNLLIAVVPMLHE